eukprot:TRINITY_DN7776_c0_g1_i1.p1 TRINITY_DN7776_c0_g1~~TRINITY_DN7776_c0_g1_i1.p1  ORF type:complete len:189 (+),score=22.85 TRINITY_DN7776_c0_g1_i1:171-737(+)
MVSCSCLAGYIKRLFHKSKNAVISLSPHELSLSIAVGLTGALFPFPGMTTPPCLLLGFIAQIPAAGHVVVQLINFSMTVFQLLCIPYLACLGEALLKADLENQDECRAKLSDIVGTVSREGMRSIGSYLSAIATACVCWLMLLPAAFSLVYLGMRVFTGLLPNWSFRRRFRQQAVLPRFTFTNPKPKP